MSADDEPMIGYTVRDLLRQVHERITLMDRAQRDGFEGVHERLDTVNGRVRKNEVDIVRLQGVSPSSGERDLTTADLKQIVAGGSTGRMIGILGLLVSAIVGLVKLGESLVQLVQLVFTRLDPSALVLIPRWWR